MTDESAPDVVALVPMTRALCHEFFRGYRNDPALAANPAEHREFEYSKTWVDAYLAKQNRFGRVHLAVLEGTRIAGEVILKDIDQDHRSAVLSIVLQADDVKGRGIGTLAIRRAAEYASAHLGILHLFADVVPSNGRSLHVLDKNGFMAIGHVNERVLLELSLQNLNSAG